MDYKFSTIHGTEVFIYVSLRDIQVCGSNFLITVFFSFNQGNIAISNIFLAFL